MQTSPGKPDWLQVAEPLPRPPVQSAQFAEVVLPPLLVVLVGTVLAGWLFALFLPVADHLWYSSLHDRNAHLYLGMSLAIDFRTLDVGHFLKDLHSARIWGPLHPLLVGIVLAIGGLDERLAVLPSLAAWVGTALFAFLAARRAVASGGNLAGLAAALFVFASPAYRAFATDVMLESLGACLSLGALYFWLCLIQDRDRRSASGLGLMLTLLFFHKYNYWLLVLLPMLVWAGTTRPFERGGWFLVAALEWDVRSWLKTQLRHPLNWILVGLLGVLGWSFWHPDELRIGSWHIVMNTPHNLISVIVVVAFVRAWPWWFYSGRHLVARLGVPVQQLVYWHVWPVILWFLWPQRLGNCLAYLTRDHGGGEAVAAGMLGGLPYYWGCLGDHYHAAPWIPWLVVSLIAIALFALPRLRPGAGMLFLFFLIAAGLTLHHPTVRSRFLHSWLGVLWILAGIGFAQLIYSQATRFVFRLRPLLAGVSVLLLIVALAPSFPVRGHAPEGGVKLGAPLVRDFINAYMPQLRDSRQAVILSNIPLKFLTGWTGLQRCAHHGCLETDLRGFGSVAEQNRPQFDHWLASTRCDTVVFLDLPVGSRFNESIQWPGYELLPAWLNQGDVFRLSYQRSFPEYGNATVTIWKRQPDSVKDRVTAR